MSQTSQRHDAATGLTDAQVIDRRARFGENALPEGKKITALSVLARQFINFLVLLLIGAALIAYALGERIDTVAILLVVALNAGLGFVQEWRAEKALDALRRMMSPHAVVIRNGRETVVAARELVPGDLVLVTAGDRVPADLTINSALELKVDESAMTGESVPVHKEAGDPAARLFMGTNIVAGRAEGTVAAIGAKTEFGKIANLTGSVGEKTTGLQKKLGLLARQLGAAALLVAGFVMAVGLIADKPVFEMMMTALSLAVALVPEGLPAVVTITLAIGAGAMVRQKALVRKLQAVETLGAASVICTDKTGTLTENKMTAVAIWMPGRRYAVKGTGYDPTGHIESGGQRVHAPADADLAFLLRTAATCNHARLYREGDEWIMVGEPTEGALVTLAEKGWVDPPSNGEILVEVPFSSERKRMSVLATDAAGTFVHTKGAPEQVLSISTDLLQDGQTRPLSGADRKQIHDAYEEMAARGLRVIALAARETAETALREDDLVFLGLVGMIDPARPEVRAAVAATKTAGIRVIIITGDGQVTATAIARDLGLRPDTVLTGTDLEQISDADLSAALRGNVLFARTAPEHKMRIVRALQDQGQIVAMTGDGVNDAPALKQADIGVSMGVRGTDVAKDASDLILLDDNFATIVRAIAEGRRQFDNVKKFVRYLLSSNAGEVIAIMANILIGGPLIFLATQILWMNLVTDGITDVALGVEKSESDQMRDKPRARDDPILGLRGMTLIALFGLYTGTASLWIFYQTLPMGEDLARTTAFTAMIFFEKFSVFAFRSLRQPNWRMGWWGNPFLLGALAVTLGAQVAAVYWPPLQILLRTVPLGWDEWGVILIFTLPLVIVPELIKTLRGRRVAA